MKKLFFVLFASACSFSPLFAKITLPKIFSDNMLLQRDMPVKVWGTSDPNAEIAVKFGAQSVSAKADAGGKWSAVLAPMSADKKPKSFSVSENGRVNVEIKNVLVGEVWIAGGQSNMQMGLNETSDFKAAAARANYPEFRYFYQNPAAIAETPQSDSPENSRWRVCTRNTAAGFSGVAFYFGEALMKDLDVPVAIVYTAMGATQVACWIPEKDAVRDAYAKAYGEEFAKKKAAYTPEVYEKRLAEHKAKMEEFAKKVEQAKAEGKPVPVLGWPQKTPPNKITPLLPTDTPFYHFNAKIAPVAGYAARGVIWYQGESNANPRNYKNYELQFANMANSWREAWGDKLPFLCVQIASFAGHNPKIQLWPEIRRSQYLASKQISGVYMANIIDCGEEKQIHPTDKTTVGMRLEKLALQKIYNKSGVFADYPALREVKYFDNRAVVVLDTFGRGLEGRGEPRGFEALVGGKWVEASAKLDGEAVEVSVLSGKIEGVRCLWKNWARPDVWLFNKDGLPAISFSNVK